jgi:hypothetical protein
LLDCRGLNPNLPRNRCGHGVPDPTIGAATPSARAISLTGGRALVVRLDGVVGADVVVPGANWAGSTGTPTGVPISAAYANSAVPIFPVTNERGFALGRSGAAAPNFDVSAGVTLADDMDRDVGDGAVEAGGAWVDCAVPVTGHAAVLLEVAPRITALLGDDVCSSCVSHRVCPARDISVACGTCSRAVSASVRVADEQGRIP